LSLIRSPSSPFNVRLIKRICSFNFNQSTLDEPHNSVGGSGGMPTRMFDKDGNGTTVLLRPNAGPINICLKRFLLLRKSKQNKVTCRLYRLYSFHVLDH
jgi:hypothetical protein